MADDPNFFHSRRNALPPLWVSGYTFDLPTRTFDFSAVPGFDLSRLAIIQHMPSGRLVYGRPLDPPLGFAAVDGVAVPPPPTSGKRLTVKDDGLPIAAGDEFVALYDAPPGI